MNHKTFLLPLAVLVVWQLAAPAISPLLLPAPLAVILDLIRLLGTGEVVPDIAFTLYRTAAGFAIAAIIAVPLGVWMGYSETVYSSLEFLVDFFRSVPATALFPLFLLLFGIGDSAKVALAAWAAGLILITYSMYGVHLSKKTRVQAARTMNVKGFTLLKKVVFPEALPHIFGGVRIAASLCLVLVVVAEMFIGTAFGMGRRIIDAQFLYNLPEMYAAILITGCIGYMLNRGIVVVERKVVYWKGK